MAKPVQQVAIITDDPGWHGRQLRQALARYGLEGRYLSLLDAAIVVDSDTARIVMPGFETAPPLGVFIRGIPGGTLEQVIFRLDILHMLVETGTTVFNTPRAIERTVDKAMTSFLLRHAGIPTPPTWVCESHEQARNIYQRETAAGHRLVMKPVFGSQGIGVGIPENPAVLADTEDFGGVYYLQRFVEPASNVFSDIRVFVIDGQAVAAMRRSHHDWITNRAQGARCEQLVMSEPIRSMAEDAVRICDIDYAGVDLIMDRNGQLQVLEVNSVPAWWGLQKVVDVDISVALIDSFVDRINQSAGNPALCR